MFNYLCSLVLVSFVALSAVGREMTDLKFMGNGCPSEGTAISLSPDREAFTVLFDEFSVSVGPEHEASESTKNCTVSFIVGPGGFLTYDTKSRGVYYLDNGVVATHTITFAVNKTTIDKKFTNIEEPVDEPGSFYSHDVFPDDLTGFPGNVVIFSQISVKNTANPQAYGTFVMDTVDVFEV